MQEINLYDLIKYYAKKWRFILIFTLIGLIGGLAYNFFQTPLYRSNTKLIIVSPETKQAAGDLTLINNYIDLMKSRRVLEPVIKEHNINKTYEQLSQSVEVTNEKGTEVINVLVSTGIPNQSAVIANAITSSFKSGLAELYNKDDVVVVDAAVESGQPYNMHKGLQLSIAVAMGFVLGMIVVYFMYDFKSGANFFNKPKNTTKRTSTRAVKNKDIIKQKNGNVPKIALKATSRQSNVPKQRAPNSSKKTKSS